MKDFLRHILRYFFHITWISIISIMLIGSFSYYKHYDFVFFTTILFYAAFVFIILGATSLMGNFGIRKDFNYQYSRTVMSTGSNRADEDIKTYDKSLSFLGLMVGVGIFLILTSLIFSFFN